MSSYPYIQFNNIFNPNDFTELDESLSLAQLDARYFKISGGFVSGFSTFLNSLNVIGNLSINSVPINLSLISNVTAGTPQNSKALTLDILGNINGNLTVTGTITGTLATAAQTSITSIGTLTGLTVSGATSITNTTESTTTSTGALIVSGGVGIAKRLNVLGNTSLTGTLLTSGVSTLINTSLNTSSNYNGVMDTASLVIRQSNNINGNKASIDFSISTNVIDAINTATCSIYHERTGVYQGDLIFSTKRVTTATSPLVEALRISSTGSCSIANTSNSDFQLNLGSSGTGINTSSITSTSITATTLTASSNLVVGTANINSTEMGYLDGAAPGNALGGKVVIMNSGNDISGIDFINCDSIIMSGLLQFQGSSNSWNFRDNIFGTYMQIDCAATSTSGIYLKLLTGNNAAYVDWTFQNTDYFNSVNMGFYRVGTNTATTGREWIRSDGGALGFSTRTPFTGSSANADIFIHNNIGVVSLGKSSLINSAHRLECNGALLISNTASTVNLTNTPTIGIYNSAQGTGIKPYVSYGKDDSTSIADYQFSGYYSGSASSANNYTLWQSNGSNGGLTMNGFSNVKITCHNGGAYSSPTGAGFEVIGHETSISVPAGYSYTPTGQTAIGGGAVSICAKFSNNVWATGIFYSTSDRRLKQDIKTIPEEDFKKILGLRPVSYTWKRDQTSTLRGFIAQEVAEHLPELVYLAENKEDPLIDDDVQQIISYSSFVPYLIGLCKMQQKEISGALRSIDDLLDRVKRLELKKKNQA